MKVLGSMLALGLLVMPSMANAKRCDDAAAVAAARLAAAAQCNCATADNHGEYVSCVADVAKTRASNGLLPTECKGEVVRCAAKSTCGKEGAVTCCRVDRRGKVKCSIKKSADKCRPPNGGTACLGSAESCCDACQPPVCEGGTTTSTSAPPVTTTSTTAPQATTTSSSAPPPTTTSTTLGGSPSGAFFETR